jgi:carboxyl-terminal processing protease
MQRSTQKLIIFVLAASIISFSIGWSFAKKTYTNPSVISVISATDNRSDPGKINDMGDVWSKLQTVYYDNSKLDLAKLKYGAVKGFVAAIGDPYTVFMTPEESKDFEDGLEGELEGIGAELTVKQGKLVVVSPLKNSPAQKAGLKPGDVIYKINDKIAEDMSLYDAIKAIRGAKGSAVKLTIIRENSPEPIEVKIVRDSIVVDSVTVEKLPGDIFHVSINQFNDHTIKEFQSAIQTILLEKAKGMVLDVRGNGGGYLDTSVAVLSELISGQQTASIIKKRDTSQNETVKTNGSGKLADIPLVVLVDKGSASASEIVAGAIQDYKRGLIIGEKTFGKGSVQELIKLDDGATLRLTIAKWFTRLNRTIDETGVAPDKEVKITEEDIKVDRDPQLDAAVSYLKSYHSSR